jgi:PhnB protein
MSAMRVDPYLFFSGQCEAALSFYQSTLGAEIVFIQRFKDAPQMERRDSPPEGVMHATLKIGDSFIFGSDGDGKSRPFGGFSLSLSVKDVAEGERVFKALADGGSVTVPFDKTFWTEGFGMVTDRFNVPWMVNVAH